MTRKRPADNKSGRGGYKFYYLALLYWYIICTLLYTHYTIFYYEAAWDKQFMDLRPSVRNLILLLSFSLLNQHHLATRNIKARCMAYVCYKRRTWRGVWRYHSEAHLKRGNTLYCFVPASSSKIQRK